MITPWESNVAMGKSSMDLSIATFDYQRVSNIFKHLQTIQTSVCQGGQLIASEHIRTYIKIIQNHKAHLQTTI